MIIGAMNHPARDVFKEIASIAEMGLEFVDLTLEPPAAASWRIDPKAIRRALDSHGLKVVGHTAYYLPLGSAIEELRRAAVGEFCRCLRVFGEIGVPYMNIHPDSHTPMHDRSFYVRQNIRSIEEMMPVAKENGVGLMIENLPGNFNSPQQLSELLDPLPDLGLHLDIGHANLKVWHNTTGEILERYGGRLRHVHLHDNKGGDADLHMPLGAGTMDVARQVRHLHASGYDGTVTLEVFTPDQHYLAYSRDVLRGIWNDLSRESG